MAGQQPWADQNYYGNAAPYTFAYNPNNSSRAYNNNGYNDSYYNNYRPTPAASAPGAYSQGNSINYTPSVTSSMREGAYGGYDRNAGYSGAGAGAGVVAGAGESVSSRWSMGSAPREKQGEDVATMMDNGKFALNEVKVARNIREYRREYREGMWTRGSRTRIFGRFFCFSIMFVIYLLISAVLGVALYIRPPSASFQKPTVDQNDITFNGGLVIPLGINISIWNPTFIKAVVKKVHVDLVYPINGEERPIGNGTVNDVWIKANSRTNFTFPVDVNYELVSDPNLEILADIAQKCGSGGQRKLFIKAKAMVAANILGVGVSSPTVPINLNIDCPFDASILQQIQSSIGNLLGVNLLGTPS